MRFEIGQRVKVRQRNVVGVVVQHVANMYYGVSVPGFEGHNCDGYAPNDDGYYYSEDELALVGISTRQTPWPPKESRRRLQFKDAILR